MSTITRRRAGPARMQAPRRSRPTTHQKSTPNSSICTEPRTSSDLILAAREVLSELRARHAQHTLACNQVNQFVDDVLAAEHVLQARWTRVLEVARLECERPSNARRCWVPYVRTSPRVRRQSAPSPVVLESRS